jgi:hypothetical protein
VTANREASSAVHGWLDKAALEQSGRASREHSAVG